MTFRVVSSFYAYEKTFTGGLYLAVGDLDGNGQAEIVTGTGVGGGPLVKSFDQNGRQLNAVFAFESTFRGGVRVAGVLAQQHVERQLARPRRAAACRHACTTSSCRSEARSPRRA